jgi:hypothetical protein
VRVLWVIGALFVVPPAFADDLSEATFGSDIFERCIAVANREFERSHSPILDRDEKTQILGMLSQDVVTCVAVAMQPCIGDAEPEACISSLEVTLDSRRLALLGELPPTIAANNLLHRGLYEGAVARAVAVEPFDPCQDDIAIAQYPEGCDVLAQAMAFQDARAAQRMMVTYGTEDR